MSESVDRVWIWEGWLPIREQTAALLTFPIDALMRYERLQISTSYYFPEHDANLTYWCSSAQPPSHSPQ